MIAAIAQKAASSWDKPPINWFDLALVALLAFGVWRGRKRGMSRECLPLLQVVTTLFVGGFCYALLGNLLIQWGVIKSVFGKMFTEKTAAYITAYVLIAVVIYVIFTFVKRAVKAKLEGSNAFGSGEYYFGMVAGFLRYAVVILIVLAVLHAPVYSAAEVAAHKKYMMDNFGLKGAQRGNFKSDDISGDYLPTVQGTQAGVFEESLIGPFIKTGLSVFLINTGGAVPAGKAAKSATAPAKP